MRKKAADLCFKNGINEGKLYNWRSRYDGMQVSDATRLRSLEGIQKRKKPLAGQWPTVSGVPSGSAGLLAVGPAGDPRPEVIIATQGKPAMIVSDSGT